MSLDETIKDLKKQIEAEDKKEDADTEEHQEEADGGEKKEEVTESKAEDTKEETTEKKEEPKTEEKATEEEKPDNAGYARLRREAAAAKKLAENTQAELDRLRTAQTVTHEEPEAVQPAAIDPEIKEVLEERRFKKAEREFQSLEQEFKGNAPDYEVVSAEYALALAQSIRLQNPRKSAGDIAEETKKTLLIKAANYMRDGFNPIEELYHEAKELGFTGNSFKKQEPKTETEAKEEPKPDMKKVAANRARSTGMAGASGRSEGQMTKQAAADLSIQEWAKLPIAEKRRLMYD